MRTLKLSLAGTGILVLVCGLAGTVVAQEDPMAPAEVTGSIELEHMRSHGKISMMEDVVIRTGWDISNRWEASDPRLSGTSDELSTWHRYPGFDVISTSLAVENEGGRWVGTSTGMGDIGSFTDAAVLHGEGAYEGLTAFLIIEWVPPSGSFIGAIFPGGMPPFPEPPAD
jgi:hypothetical protein